MNFENDTLVDSSFTMAVFLVANPNVTVRKWENGKFTDFVYDIHSGKFYYCTPKNKVRNGWYEARGLKCHFDRGMHYMLGRKPTEIINVDEEDLPF